MYVLPIAQAPQQPSTLEHGGNAESTSTKIQRKPSQFTLHLSRNSKGSLLDLTKPRVGLNPLPRAEVEVGDYTLIFQDTPAIEGALIIQEFLPRLVGAHPCRIFSHFNDVTTLGEDGSPLEEIPLQIMSNSSLIPLISDDKKVVVPHIRYYTLIRQRTAVNRLVIKELLDKGAIGLLESRWLWLWFANTWDSWRITLMEKSKLYSLPAPERVTQITKVKSTGDDAFTVSA